MQNSPYAKETASAARAVDYVNKCDPHKSFASGGLHVAKDELKQAFADLMSLSRSWSTSSCRRKDALIASADIPAITSPDLRASNVTIIEDH